LRLSDSTDGAERYKLLGIKQQFRRFLSNASFRADAGLGIVGSPSPDSDYYYHSLGYRSGAGPMVSPGSATRLSAVFACTRVCAETLGSLPFAVFRERKSGGRDLAKDHPAYELFLKPNLWQNSMDFFEMMQIHLELRGNAYALKVPSNDRAIGQLIPLHPDRVRVYVMPDNRLRYEVTSYSSGQIDRYVQEEILHIRAMSQDGIMGMSTVSAMSEVIGVGLAQQEHRARYFRNNAVPGMAIETVKMTEEAREQMVNSISEKFSGEGAFKVMAMPPGTQVKQLGLTNKDSQLIEASDATKVEICGAWRVPPHKIGDLSKGTFSNIEQQNIEFATDCMRPRVIRSERRLDMDIVDPLRAYESAMGDYFFVFDMDAIFRGDMKSRYDSYSQAINSGWLLRQEARMSEGKNPVKGLDEPLVASTMETISQSQMRTQAKYADSTSGEDDLSQQELGGDAETPGGDADSHEDNNARRQSTHLRAMALNAAGRMVRREVKSLRKINNADAFEEKLSALYADLAPVISESMVIPLDNAESYLAEHRKLLAGVFGKPVSAKTFGREQIIALIEESAPAMLAALALNAQQSSAGERIQ
jgi:HK97 family phage portal protein